MSNQPLHFSRVPVASFSPKAKTIGIAGGLASLGLAGFFISSFSSESRAGGDGAQAPLTVSRTPTAPVSPGVTLIRGAYLQDPARYFQDLEILSTQYASLRNSTLPLTSATPFNKDTAMSAASAFAASCKAFEENVRTSFTNQMATRADRTGLDRIVTLEDGTILGPGARATAAQLERAEVLKHRFEPFQYTNLGATTGAKAYAVARQLRQGSENLPAAIDNMGRLVVGLGKKKLTAEHVTNRVYGFNVLLSEAKKLPVAGK